MIKNDLLKSEILRFEERSILFLKGFSLVWFTLIFFIIKEGFNGGEFSNILKNLTFSIINFNLGSSFITLYLTFVTLSLIIIVLFNLSKNSISSPICINLKTIDFKKVFSEKYYILRKSLFHGIITTIFLVFYLVFVYNIGNNNFLNNFNLLLAWSTGIFLLLISFFMPIYFIVRILKLKVKSNVDILVLISNFISFIFFIFLVIYSYFGSHETFNSIIIFFGMIYFILLILNSFIFCGNIISKIDKLEYNL